jgi:hypothetical protein
VTWQQKRRSARKRRGDFAEEKEQQILNSITDCTGQGKFKEMLDAKYANTEYCVTCFRLFRERYEHERRLKLKDRLWLTQWSTYTTEHVLNFIESKWRHTRYQEVCFACPLVVVIGR